MKKLLFTVLLLVFLAQAVSANVQFSGPETIQVNACLSTTHTLTIQNSGAQAIMPQITLDARSAIANWMTFAPQQTIIPPGQSRDITVHITVPCQQQGTFNYAFVIDTGNEQLRLPQQLQVSRNANFVIAAAQNTIESCPCEPQRMTFEVTNTESFTDVFTATIRGTANAQVVPERRPIFPGQTETFTVFLSTPCEFNGNIDFAVDVASEIAGFTARVPFAYNVNACYDYSLVHPEEIFACLDGDTEVNLTITNDMHFENTYTINTDPRWVDPRTAELTLLPNQTGVLSLLLQPRSGWRGVQEGQHTLVIDARTHLGNERTIFEMPVNVQSCYLLSLDAPNQRNFCPGDDTLYFTVTNHGEFAEEIQLDARSSAQVLLSEQRITLQPGESREIEARVLNTTGRTQVYLDASLVDNALITRTAQISVTPVSQEQCYAVNAQPLRFSEDGESHEITFTHAGHKSGTYMISFDSDNFWVEDSQIRLDPGQSVTLTVYSVGAGESVSMFVEGEGVRYEYRIDFGIHPAFLIVGFILLAILILAILVLAVMMLKSRAKAKEAKRDVVVEEIQKLYRPKRNSNVWLTVLIILIALIALIIVVPLLPEPVDTTYNETDPTDPNAGGGIFVPDNQTTMPTHNVTSPLTQRQIEILKLEHMLQGIPSSVREGFAYQIIDAGTKHTINLSNYFADPDGDQLFFAAFSMDNITLTIEEDIVTMTPDEEFIGVRYTIFFARDIQGASTQSPVVNVIVVPTNLTQEAIAVRDEFGPMETIDQLFSRQYPEQFPAQDTRQVTLTFVIILALLVIMVVATARAALYKPAKPKPTKKPAKKVAKKRKK